MKLRTRDKLPILYSHFFLKSIGCCLNLLAFVQIAEILSVKDEQNLAENSSHLNQTTHYYAFIGNHLVLHLGACGF